jgi:HD-like signal output (HDOD) protein
MLDYATLKTALAAVPVLPTLPHVQQRLTSAVVDQRRSITEVGNLVALDPVLTALVLQAANAWRSTAAEKVTTTSRATRLVGLNVLRTLVEAQAKSTEFTTAHVIGQMQQVWLHSLATAIAARTIAVHSGYPVPEECYVGGLLHDIGKLAWLQLVPDTFETACVQAERSHQTLYQWEVASGMPSHARVGGLLAQQWALPAPLNAAITWHHTPQLTAGNRQIVAITHIADILARALDLGSGGDSFVPRINATAQHVLHFKPGEVRGIMLDIDAEFAKVLDLDHMSRAG